MTKKGTQARRNGTDLTAEPAGHDRTDVDLSAEALNRTHRSFCRVDPTDPCDPRRLLDQAADRSGCTLSRGYRERYQRSSIKDLAFSGYFIAWELYESGIVADGDTDREARFRDLLEIVTLLDIRVRRAVDAT